MNFWQSFALYQLSAALHMLVGYIGARYLKPDELAAVDVLLNAIVSLPQRVHPTAASAQTEGVNEAPARLSLTSPAA